jgi:hypothetical protein
MPMRARPTMVIENFLKFESSFSRYLPGASVRIGGEHMEVDWRGVIGRQRLARRLLIVGWWALGSQMARPHGCIELPACYLILFPPGARLRCVGRVRIIIPMLCGGGGRIPRGLCDAHSIRFRTTLE